MRDDNGQHLRAKTAQFQCQLARDLADEIEELIESRYGIRPELSFSNALTDFLAERLSITLK